MTDKFRKELYDEILRAFLGMKKTLKEFCTIEFGENAEIHTYIIHMCELLALDAIAADKEEGVLDTTYKGLIRCALGDTPRKERPKNVKKSVDKIVEEIICSHKRAARILFDTLYDFADNQNNHQFRINWFDEKCFVDQIDNRFKDLVNSTLDKIDTILSDGLKG